MSLSAAAWQLDRLSAGAREAAEVASLAAGQSLSSWLTRIITETCDAEGVAAAHDPPQGHSSKIIEFSRELRERASTAALPAAIIAAKGDEESPDDSPAFEVEAAAATTAAPSETGQIAPIVLPPAENATLAPAGPKMLPVAAMMTANLGTRRGETLPDALLSDIATRGVRQPLLLRRAAAHADRYEIVCGHRRWRAAQQVGLMLVPGIVGSYDDEAAILASLKENLALGTLSPIEEAAAYLRLLTQCAMDASVLIAAIDRDRPHIVRCMRLLGLPPLVRHLIASGMLSPDHAYLLLDAPDPEALADAILADGLSVAAARQRLADGDVNEAKS